MKDLNIYQQLQFAVLAVFFLAFVVTGSMVIIMPSVPENITALFGELKSLFLLLLSAESLRQAIIKTNKGDEQ